MFVKTLDEISKKQFQDNTKCPPKKKVHFLAQSTSISGTSSTKTGSTR